MMITAKQSLAWLRQFVTKHSYLSVTIGVLLLVSATTGAIVLASDSGKNSPDKADTQSAVRSDNNGAATTKTQSSADNGTSASTATPAAGTVSNTKAIQSKPKLTPQSNTPTSQKQLVISPTTITINAGGSFNGLTLRTDDGQAINTPGLSSMPPGVQMFLNFPAGPAKQTWSGSIGVIRTAKPGTYTMELFGQTNSAAYYRGSLKVTILPTPIMVVSMQQTGYDAAQDALIFHIRIDRLYGYSKPIESWYGRSWNTNVPLQMECPIYAVDDSNLIMRCSHVNGPRPTSGTMHVNINMADDSFNAEAAFNLPPL